MQQVRRITSLIVLLKVEHNLRSKQHLILVLYLLLLYVTTIGYHEYTVNAN